MVVSSFLSEGCLHYKFYLFINNMDPNSSLGKICLRDDVVVIPSDRVEGSRDWNSLEYQDTVGSKGKKVVNALSFYKMEMDDISERYIAPCFVNGLEAYDGEGNLEFEENLISKEFAVKLCLENEEDDFEPGFILGRSFLRLAHGVIDFSNEVIMIYLEPDPFKDDSKKTGKSSDDWDPLLDFNFDDVPRFREELTRPSSSAEGHLIQEEAEKEALAIRISLHVQSSNDIAGDCQRGMRMCQRCQDFLLERDYDQFVQNYNMYSMRKTIPKLHARLKLTEKGIPKKSLVILAIRQGQIQKPKLQARGKGKRKGKSKLTYTLNQKIPPHEKKEHPAKDAMSCFKVWRDEDGNTKYRPVAPSFLDIEDDMERVLAMEAYFNPFKNIIVFKKLVDFIGSLPIQLKSTNWGNEGHGVYKKVEGDGAWHAKFEVITLSRRKFTRGFKTKNTKRKLSGKFTSKDILKFDHFLDLRAHQSKHKVKHEE
uniref:Zinc finger, CCHC-type n=1 Tax=Tanacetum cinerariifolium TaxID=118510 RepID=A0A6L2N4J8_TANCI|nr:zinc finger, CCHC-type [Tanacetum cinerariifolium]